MLHCYARISSSDAGAEAESAGMVNVPFLANIAKEMNDAAIPGRIGCMAPIIPGAENPVMPMDVGLYANRYQTAVPASPPIEDISAAADPALGPWISRAR